MERIEADVAIIGGGIVGASTAFHLRTVHGRSVVLLERGFVGAQASGVNFGNVRRQGRFLPQLPLAHRSRTIWGRLTELLGEDCEFSVTGHVKVAFNETEMAELEDHAAKARDYGLDLELLGRNSLRDRYPWLGPDIIGGSLSANDGSANPRLAAPAFARAAQRAGANIREQAEVTDIGHDGRSFGVTTASGVEVRAPVLVNAAGAWGAKIAAKFGESAPVVARGPQMAVTEPVPYFITPVLGCVSGDIYIRQIPRGNVIYGGGPQGPADAASLRAAVKPDNTLAQFGRLQRFVPALRALHILRVWSGIEGYLPDMIPIMGPSRTTPGLYHAFAFCGHGFQLGPGVGAVMADLAAAGKTETPIAPFDIGRFATAGQGRVA